MIRVNYIAKWIDEDDNTEKKIDVFKTCDTIAGAQKVVREAIGKAYEIKSIDVYARPTRLSVEELLRH